MPEFREHRTSQVGAPQEGRGSRGVGSYAAKLERAKAEGTGTQPDQVGQIIMHSLVPSYPHPSCHYIRDKVPSSWSPPCMHLLRDVYDIHAAQHCLLILRYILLFLRYVLILELCGKPPPKRSACCNHSVPPTPGLFDGRLTVSTQTP